MSQHLKGSSLIATLLLIFIIVVAVAMWSLDLIVQQRTFAFLLSAELVAFAMLVYLYYQENPKELSKRWLFIGATGLAMLILLGAAVFLGVSPTSSASTPDVNIVLCGGEISSTLYGFGYSLNNLTSLDPTLTFKVDDVVNLTITNVGQPPHDWAIASDNQSSSAPVLFHAQIASPNNPLQHGRSGSMVFTVTQAGDYYYICQVLGHEDVGMLGRMMVNP
jgi:uncharacterized cupredoxin-like copper-binding protein